MSLKSRKIQRKQAVILTAAAPEEKVGYRRPPKAHRFKPGQSGNPEGRPRDGRSLSRVLDEALAQRTTVRVDGRARKVTKLEAMTRKLADLAAQGDARIVRLLLGELHKAEERAAEEPAMQDAFSAADQEVIATLIVRLGERR